MRADRGKTWGESVTMKLSSYIVQRLDRAGNPIRPGDLNLAADIVALCGREAEGWTHRYDDAMRIPDVLGEAADVLRDEAKRLAALELERAAVEDRGLLKGTP